jgi:hypothetical protein
MNPIVLVGTRDGWTQSARACKARHGIGKKLGVQRRPQRTPCSTLHLALRTWVSGPQ